MSYSWEASRSSCVSYSPHIQIRNLLRALGSLILHHSYAHSCFSIKFSARSAYSQTLKRKSTLASGWLRATMSSAVSKLSPPSPDHSLPEKIQAKSTLPAGGERTLPSFHHAFDLQENASSEYTFNIHSKLATSKGKQLPTATFLLYSFVMGGARAGFWKKKKKRQTQAFHLFVKKNAKSTTGFFFPNL